jgi:hypothetical protein
MTPLSRRNLRGLGAKLPPDRDRLRAALEPFRDGLVIGCECLFAWYWLADWCAAEGIPFVLGHALYLLAVHGGKTKTDTVDARKLARLLRGGRPATYYAAGPTWSASGRR